MSKIKKLLYIAIIPACLILLTLKCFQPAAKQENLYLPPQPGGIPFKFGEKMDPLEGEKYFGKIVGTDRVKTDNGRLGKSRYKSDLSNEYYGKCTKYLDGTRIITVRNIFTAIDFSRESIKSNFGLSTEDSKEKVIRLYGHPDAIYEFSGPKYPRFYRNNERLTWWDYTYKVDMHKIDLTASKKIIKYSEYTFKIDQHGTLYGVSFEYQKDDRNITHILPNGKTTIL